MDHKFKHCRLNTVIWIFLKLGNMAKVDGGINISPSVPEMGALSPSDAVFTCDSSGLQFSSISSMQISRKRATVTDFTLLASIFNVDLGLKLKFIPFLASGTDLTTRDGISLSGSGIQSDNAQVSSLQLKIKQVNLICTDEAEYECKVSYLIPSLNSETDTSHTDLTIFVPPKDLTLTVTHNGTEPGKGQESNPTEFSVGDVIQLSCSGSIGSNRNQEFKWQRTPLSGFSAFNPYNPDSKDENKGTVPATAVNCMYNRTATLSYNITSEDGNRNTVWGFKCEAEYGTQTSTHKPYYITVPGGSTMPTSTDSTGESTMTTPTDSTVACASEEDILKTTAIIIGVVEAVIIVGLTAVVVFLLTRSNTSGQGNSDTRGTELSNYEDLGQRTPADYDVLKLPSAAPAAPAAPSARHKWNCLCP